MTDNGKTYMWDNISSLTKREYFAAMALKGILSHPNSTKQADGTNHTYETLAIAAVDAADALIDTLNDDQK